MSTRREIPGIKRKQGKCVGDRLWGGGKRAVGTGASGEVEGSSSQRARPSGLEHNETREGWLLEKRGSNKTVRGVYWRIGKSNRGRTSIDDSIDQILLDFERALGGGFELCYLLLVFVSELKGADDELRAGGHGGEGGRRKVDRS